MAWLQLHIDLTSGDLSALETALETSGALAITLRDSGDQPLLEPGVGETPLWDRVGLTALFDTSVNTADIDALTLRHAGQPGEWARLEERAWEREWLKRFAPQQFGPQLWIVPGELPAPDPDATNVRLDPGLAFGTGDHATTALCLGWIGACDLSGQRVLDYGCGSGILAIAALMSGAAGATAVDNDPQALIATRQNAERNHVADRLEWLAPEQLTPATYDVVLANILATPLIQLAPRICAAVAPGGQLVLSGILHDQVDDVMTAYSHVIDWASPQRRADWMLISGGRRESR